MKATATATLDSTAQDDQIAETNEPAAFTPAPGMAYSRPNILVRGLGTVRGLFAAKQPCRIGIDWGTTKCRVIAHNPRNGNQLFTYEEPSITVVDKVTGKIIAVGNEALAKEGKLKENEMFKAAVDDGVPYHIDVATALGKHMLEKFYLPGDKMPDTIVTGIPFGTKPTDFSAFEQIAKEMGIKHVKRIGQPMLIALANRARTGENDNGVRTVMDGGGSTTDLLIACDDEVLLGHSIKSGGNKINAALAQWIHRNKRIDIGNGEAGQSTLVETLKLRISGFEGDDENATFPIPGKPLMKNLPEENLHITLGEFMGVVNPFIIDIANQAETFLEKVHPMVYGKVMEGNLILGGRNPLMRGYKEIMHERLGMTCVHDRFEGMGVTTGLGECLLYPELIPRCLMEKP